MKKTCELLYKSSINLLTTLAILVFITSVLWLLKIPMLAIYLPLSYLISLMIQYFFLKNSKKEVLIIAIIGFAVILISIILTGRVYDQSDDGNTYHKETIGLIANGWNPIYDDYDEYATENDLPHMHTIWAKHYPKTTWIIGSAIYKLTGNIETAKSYNCLFMFIGLFIISYGIYQLIGNNIGTFIIGLIAVTNPIVMSQVLSLYVDGALSILLFITIIEMLLLNKDKINSNFYLIILSTLILTVNIKFTGLAYTGIFSMAFYLYYLFVKIKNKDYIKLKKMTLFFLTTVIIAIFICGSNSYVTNTIVAKHPLYPLAGKNKHDIMTSLQPASFQNMSPIKKNYYAIFSKTANIGVFNNGEPVLKIPFTYDDYEISQIDYDTRIGGYGIFFSGILLLAITINIAGITKMFKNKEYDKLILMTIPLIVIILLLFFLSDGWWARYAPYLYFIVLESLFVLIINKKKTLKVIYFFYTILILVNAGICFKSIANRSLPLSGTTRNTLQELKNQEINIVLSSERFTGILFNLKDYNIDYNTKNNNQSELLPLYSDFVKYSKD